MKDESHVALVTGANRGIGLEVCRQLAALGHQVILSSRNQSRAEAAVASLGKNGREVFPIELDVTSVQSVKKAAREITNRLKRVDILVNNAAVLIRENASILSTGLEDFRLTFETNVFGVVAVSQVFVPGMVDRGYGRVVNVSSGVGQLTYMTDYAPAYSMSKTALNALTRQLAAATKNRGVLVNSVNPGWVRTAMGGPGAPRSVEEGAETIVWLATLPARGPTGGFFSDRRQIEW